MLKLQQHSNIKFHHGHQRGELNSFNQFEKLNFRNQSSVESVKSYTMLEKTNGNHQPSPLTQTNPMYDSSNSSNEPNKLSALSSSESINSQEGEE